MRHRVAFAASYRLAALPFGITPQRCWVEVTTAAMRVRYGLWSLETPLTNITGTVRSGGFSFVKTAGPPHLSFADRGVSFTPNGDDALCVSFRDAVPGIDPTGLLRRVLRHPGVTLGVEDPERLRTDLRDQGATV
ncbi:hypothetical protein [Nocardioides acrostichi]|uniref:Uncharacterized protein n=1 Tax=Nocardioides acrostichi TaxID=2784339 RepID=A0A930V0R8_9ACTN|nr:hypothetical protein [Nocardioides acrostichi]MBF4161610.1 hypothetical protein [Nocardioides acrostichi]